MMEIGRIWGIFWFTERGVLWSGCREDKKRFSEILFRNFETWKEVGKGCGVGGCSP